MSSLRAVPGDVVGSHHNATARNRPRADVHPVALIAWRPRLEPELVQAAEITGVRDLLGYAAHEHAPTGPRGFVDAVDLERSVRRFDQRMELRAKSGPENDRLRGLVEQVVDRSHHR